SPVLTAPRTTGEPAASYSPLVGDERSGEPRPPVLRIAGLPLAAGSWRGSVGVLFSACHRPVTAVSGPGNGTRRPVARLDLSGPRRAEMQIAAARSACAEAGFLFAVFDTSARAECERSATMERLTIREFQRRKRAGEPIVMITAYD